MKNLFSLVLLLVTFQVSAQVEPSIPSDQLFALYCPGERQTINIFAPEGIRSIDEVLLNGRGVDRQPVSSSTQPTEGSLYEIDVIFADRFEGNLLRIYYTRNDGGRFTIQLDVFGVLSANGSRMLPQPIAAVAAFRACEEETRVWSFREYQLRSGFLAIEVFGSGDLYSTTDFIYTLPAGWRINGALSTSSSQEFCLGDVVEITSPADQSTGQITVRPANPVCFSDCQEIPNLSDYPVFRRTITRTNNLPRPEISAIGIDETGNSFEALANNSASLCTGADNAILFTVPVVNGPDGNPLAIRWQFDNLDYYVTWQTTFFGNSYFLISKQAQSVLASGNFNVTATYTDRRTGCESSSSYSITYGLETVIPVKLVQIKARCGFKAWTSIYSVETLTDDTDRADLIYKWYIDYSLYATTTNPESPAIIQGRGRDVAIGVVIESQCGTSDRIQRRFREPRDCAGDIEKSNNENDIFDNPEETVLYPNPATDYFRIKGLDTEFTEVRLLNSDGQIVRLFKGDQLNQPLGVSGLPIGMYFVRTLNRSTSVITTAKLIVK